MRILFALVVAAAAIWVMKAAGILDGSVIVMSIIAAVAAALVAWITPVPRVPAGIVAGLLVLAVWLVPGLSEFPAALWAMAIIAAVLIGLTLTVNDRVQQSRASTGH